nr:cyclophilin-like fold protein [Clostridium transplantifaecale]
MKISVEGNGHTVVFQLVDNSASRSLYKQLPFTVEVQDYSNDEKIFYPPEKLDITDASLGQGPAGSLAYFSSWGNVIMYYGSYGPYNGLYELGTAISGSEFIETMSGTLQIQKSATVQTAGKVCFQYRRLCVRDDPYGH